MGEVRFGLLEPTTFTNIQMGKEMRFFPNDVVCHTVLSFPFYMHIGQFTGQFLIGNKTCSKKVRL